MTLIEVDFKIIIKRKYTDTSDGYKNLFWEILKKKKKKKRTSNCAEQCINSRDIETRDIITFN